jgi:hypothetical protein
MRKDMETLLSCASKLQANSKKNELRQIPNQTYDWGFIINMDYFPYHKQKLEQG